MSPMISVFMSVSDDDVLVTGDTGVTRTHLTPRPCPGLTRSGHQAGERPGSGKCLKYQQLSSFIRLVHGHKKREHF